MNAADLGAQIYNTVHSRGLEDNEDLFVRNLEARDPSELSAVGSVFFYTSFNKYPLNADLWSYSKAN